MELPLLIIQNHYEFYLANKIYSVILLGATAVFAVMTATLLALTVTLTLSAEVIAKHGAKDEVFFGRELVERPVDKHPNGIETLLLAEEEVETVVTYGLDDIGDA